MKKLLILLILSLFLIGCYSRQEKHDIVIKQGYKTHYQHALPNGQDVLIGIKERKIKMFYINGIGQITDEHDISFICEGTK